MIKTYRVTVTEHVTYEELVDAESADEAGSAVMRDVEDGAHSGAVSVSYEHQVEEC